MGTIALFYTSGALIIAFLFLKSLELKRGARYGESFWSSFDRLARVAKVFFVDVAPYKLAHNTLHLFASGLHSILRIILTLLRLAEVQLVRITRLIRGKKELHKKKATSQFLTEAIESKKNDSIRNSLT